MCAMTSPDKTPADAPVNAASPLRLTPATRKMMTAVRRKGNHRLEDHKTAEYKTEKSFSSCPASEKQEQNTESSEKNPGPERPVIFFGGQHCIFRYRSFRHDHGDPVARLEPLIQLQLPPEFVGGRKGFIAVFAG